jgi:Flp pilus assembly protein TadB
MGPDLFPVAVAGGAMLGGGLLALVVFVLGGPPREHSTPQLAERLRVTVRVLGTRVGAGIAVGIGVLVLTRWVVLAAALGFLAASWRKVFGGAAEERAGIGRLDALASWTESLRDTIAGAVGLEQAIPATAATSAPAIRPALNLLVDRLRIREPLPDALMRFADDLNDPSADLIVGSLVLNARLRGPGLRDVLTALGASAREELDMRRRIEASRKSTRRSVQIVVGVTLGVAAMLILLNRRYVAPYGTIVGQVVLLVVVALFAGGVLWLRRLAHVEMPSRFLVGGPAAIGGVAGTAGSGPAAGHSGAGAGGPGGGGPRGGGPGGGGASGGGPGGGGAATIAELTTGSGAGAGPAVGSAWGGSSRNGRVR